MNHRIFTYTSIYHAPDCAGLCSERMIAVMLDPASTRTALEQMESYCAAHPNSPSAIRRPGLSIRSGGLWIALLGPNVEQGIVGIGYSVESALSAFDRQYMAGLRPPSAE